MNISDVRRMVLTVAATVLLLPVSLWASKVDLPTKEFLAPDSALSFEANLGQTDQKVNFLSRGSGYTLYLTSTEAVMVLKKVKQKEAQALFSTDDMDVQTVGAKNILPRPTHSKQEQVVLRMGLLGANPKATGMGVEKQPGKSHYFIGNDPKAWHADVPHYAKVRFQNVYSGVDLVYYGNQRQMEYDFVVAPNVDPGVIVLDFRGQDGLKINAHGDLVIGTEGGEILLMAPVIYQEINGIRSVVDGRYRLKGGGQICFEVAAYDRSWPLIIDPMLSYSTYLGGGDTDTGYNIAVDGSGNAYVVGDTSSLDFPMLNPFQGVNAGSRNVFVTKLDSTGSAISYSTYLGGSSVDTGYGIAVDGSGNVYVTGQTSSLDFPMLNPFQGVNAGREDAFVAKLDSTGSAISYSTYLGGRDDDASNSIAVDGSGNAYVTGQTISTNFPTANPIFPARANALNDDAFVTKLDSTGSVLVYSTHLGGSRDDYGRGIAVDGSGNAYVTGSTSSTDFPTVNPIPPGVNAGGITDAFVTKFDSTGLVVFYSTYLGGNDQDVGNGIAVDGSMNAYVAGVTSSINFPVVNPVQGVYAGSTDGFVTKLGSAGSTLSYSTYLGGSGEDRGLGIAVNGVGNAYVTGRTASTNFPTVNPSQGTFAGSVDAFVTKLSSAGSALFYSTYLGGSSSDYGRGIAVDGVGNVYVTGDTGSTDFPIVNPLLPGGGANAGSSDIFVARLDNTDPDEVCDGFDNDLDGLIDEGFPDTDGDGVADCVDLDDDNDGVSNVDELAAGSDPSNAASTPEVCDGLDNDLDGLIDEGFPDTDGDGVSDCVDTTPLGVCNGLSVTILGTMENDVIVGTTGSDVILALDGDDTVNGRNGDDVICGGNGNDTLSGKNDMDTLDGGAGDDTCSGGNGVDTAMNCETVSGVP